MTTHKVLLVKSLDRIKNMGGEVYAITLDDIHCSEDGFFDVDPSLGPLYQQLEGVVKDKGLGALREPRKWKREAMEWFRNAIPAEEKRGESSVSAEALATLAGITLAKCKAPADEQIWTKRSITTMASITAPDLQYAYAPLA